MAFTFPATVWISFNSEGWICFLPLLYAFGIIPGLEFFTKNDTSNLDPLEAEIVSADKIYDLIIYLTIPVQYFLLIYFFNIVSIEKTTYLTLIGRTIAMGLMCGIFGINIAHELGHRNSGEERFLAKALLLTSLYLHFYIEHNRGHHRNVATPDDPATARVNENVYFFWMRTIALSYLSAWQIEAARLKKLNLRVISFKNQMLIFQLIQLCLLIIVGLYFGSKTLICFLIAAFIGIILLETVNYVEHYGLMRSKREDGKYEKVLHTHSWNSNHLIGRVMLFELSRHSDHHYKASKPYQLLNHWDESPQMPTGYPGMMILSLIPPLWFMVMNKRLKQFQSAQ
jgi:alkane 1-monooxygenase